MTLNDRVREALTNAKDNGYYFKDTPVDIIALDLIRYDAALEGETLANVITSIISVTEGKP